MTEHAPVFKRRIQRFTPLYTNQLAVKISVDVADAWAKCKTVQLPRIFLPDYRKNSQLRRAEALKSAPVFVLLLTFANPSRYLLPQGLLPCAICATDLSIERVPQ